MGTMVSMWPGLVKTENVEDGALSSLKERRGLAPGSPEFDLSDLLSTPLAETPLFIGRAVAALARDADMKRYTGKVVLPAVMASGYGFVDERGVRTPPFTSVKFMVSVVLTPLLKHLGIWEVPGAMFQENPGLVGAAKFYWSSLPDLSFPGKLIKLTSGAPNLW